MFRKELKIKSNTQLKRNESKALKHTISQLYTDLTESDLNDIFGKKDQINLMKATTFNDEAINIYIVNGKPLFFTYVGLLLPTVYLLWRHPFLPAFTTNDAVVSRIYNGADFMVPGLITPPGGYSGFGYFPLNTVFCINTTKNKAAIAVGVTAMDSYELSRSGGTGKLLSVQHYYGDKLCTLGGVSLDVMPSLGVPEFLRVDFQENECTEIVCEEEEETDVLDKNEMDDLLLYCLLAALKYSKSLSLPILTSNFYKLQMMPLCPQGKILNVKKSSYKKVGEFMSKVSEMGLITTKELKKGVESIVDFNKVHPKFAEFYLDPSERPTTDNNLNNEHRKHISEAYTITASVAPLFRDAGLRKGDVVQTPDVRKYVTEYIKKYNYQDVNNKGLINVRGELLEIIKHQGTITWEELFDKVFKSLKACYKITSETKDTFGKGKIEPIMMSISTRSGNKKVTLVDNLELYDIPMQEFAKKCQHGVAASTSISQVKGKKSLQLLVQGNQINYVHKLLKDEYKIPDKYMRGLELGKKN